MTLGLDKRRFVVYTGSVIALTLLAFAMRLYQLEFYSLRGDEAIDILIASQPVGDIVDQMRSVHPYPPLFHVGLHYWTRVAGTSVVADRFYGGVWFATLIVPAMYAFGTLLFGRKVGLMAALLATVNPFLQWWAQDGHIYAHVVAMAALMNVTAIRLWKHGVVAPPSAGQTRGRQTRLAVVYVVVALLSLLTNYFAFFCWGGLNLLAIVYTLRRRWPRSLVIHWWVSQAVLLLLYLPWIVYSLSFTAGFVQPWVNPVLPGEIVWRTLMAFGLGYVQHFTITASPVIPWLAGLLGVVCLVGVGLGWRRQPARPALAVSLTLFLAPLVAMYLASLYRPMYDEKYVIVLLSPFLVILAAAVVEIARWQRPAGLVVGAIVVTIMLFAAAQYQFNEAAAKSPDWRAAFNYIHDKSRPGDILIYNFPESAVPYYNADRLPIKLIPSSADQSAAEIGARLESAADEYTRIWLVPLNRPWWDTRGDTLAWLDRYTERTGQVFFRGVNVNMYRTPNTWRKDMVPQPVDFAQGIHLLGFRLPETLEETGVVVLSPGDTLHLSLFWQSDGPTQVPYTVFTHLVGPDGKLYGQWDNAPVWGTYPTTNWEAGETVVDLYDIPISPEAPQGEYSLLVGLYDPASGERLTVLAQDSMAQHRDHVQLEREIVIQ